MKVIRNTLKGLAYFIGGDHLRRSLETYCRLVTAHDAHVLVADDNSLVSVFPLCKARRML